jgi:hypothetical protein
MMVLARAVASFSAALWLQRARAVKASLRLRRRGEGFAFALEAGRISP